jgi:hypothetical protein
MYFALIWWWLIPRKNICRNYFYVSKVYLILTLSIEKANIFTKLIGIGPGPGPGPGPGIGFGIGSSLTSI